MFHSFYYWELSRRATSAGQTRLHQEREEFKKDIKSLSSKLPLEELKAIWIRVLNRVNIVGPLSEEERKQIAKGLFNPDLDSVKHIADALKDLKATKIFLSILMDNNLALSLETIRKGSFLNRIMARERWVTRPTINEKSSRMGKIALKVEKFLANHPQIDIEDEYNKLMPENRFAFAGFTKDDAKQFPNIAKYLHRLGYAIEIEQEPDQSPRNGR